MPVCCIQLGVALVNILHDIRRPLVDLHRRIFLYLYLFSQLLEEKAEFSDGRLDALDLVVAGAHRAEDAVGDSGAVRFQLCK